MTILLMAIKDTINLVGFILYYNAFEWYTVEYPMSHLYFLVYTRAFRRVCVYQESTSDGWDIPRLYHMKGLHNYYIPCHRKYSGQMGRLGVIQLNCTD